MYKSKQFKGKKRGILCEQKGKSRKMRLTQKGRAKQVICKVESQNQENIENGQGEMYSYEQVAIIFLGLQL